MSKGRDLIWPAIVAGARVYKQYRAVTDAPGKFPGSRTVTEETRKRKRMTAGQVNAYVKSSYRRGRKRRRNLRAAWKLLNQNLSSRIMSYRNYSQFGGTSGALYLGNISTTPTTGVLQVPCHLWEITSAPNVVGTPTGTVTYPTIGWFPRFTDPTAAGTLTWINSGAFSFEDTDSALNSFGNAPNGNDTLDWVSIRTLLYAPSDRPARFQLDVIQIKDTRLVPDTVTGIGAFATAFWQNQLKRFTYSPLEVGDVKYGKYIKYLDSKSFIIDPKESTDPNSNNYREVNLFYRFNRRCTYNWGDADPVAPLVANEGPVNTGADIKTQVHPRARIFFMIRAQAVNGIGDAAHFLKTPSYDLVIRAKHSALNS